MTRYGTIINVNKSFIKGVSVTGRARFNEEFDQMYHNTFVGLLFYQYELQLAVRIYLLTI